MTLKTGISKITGSSSDKGFLLHHNMAEAFRWRSYVLAWVFCSQMERWGTSVSLLSNCECCDERPAIMTSFDLITSLTPPPFP